MSNTHRGGGRVDRELWIKLNNETLKSEKEIHLYKNDVDTAHPWTVTLRNILHGRSVAVDNVADSFEEGMVRVREHLGEAARLGYAVVEKRT